MADEKDFYEGSDESAVVNFWLNLFCPKYNCPDPENEEGICDGCAGPHRFA